MDMDVAQLEATVEKAYTAYSEALMGRDDSGRPLPPYGALHDVHKAAWRQAVMAAIAAPVAPPKDAPAPAAAPTDDEDEKDARPRGRRS